METTVDLAVEHMCSWKQLINSMKDRWQENMFIIQEKKSIKEVLIEEIKELLAFSSTEISFCRTFKEKKEEVYENFKALMELNNFENPEWTKEEAPLVDEIEIRIYPRWPHLSLSHKKRTDGTPSKVLFLIFPFS